MKFYIWVFFENMLRKFKFHQNPTKIMDTLHGDLWTHITISWWILLRVEVFTTKILEKIQTRIFTFNNFFYPQKLCHLRGIVAKYGKDRQATDGNITQHKRCDLHAQWLARIHSTHSLILKTYFFSEATIVPRIFLNAVVHTLPVFYLSSSSTNSKQFITFQI